MPEICAVNYIDHVGVAVSDIRAALEFFAANFGSPDAEVVELDDQAVRACLIEIGQTRLELLEPLSPESAVGRFIERRGEGLHHLALNVDDIGGKLKILSANGLSLIDAEPRHGLSGSYRFRASPLGVWRTDRIGRELTHGARLPGPAPHYSLVAPDMPAHVIYGDSFLVAERLRRVKTEAGVADLMDSNRHVVSAGRARPDEVLAMCNSLPFLDTMRLVEIEGVLATQQGSGGGRRSGRRSASATGAWTQLVDAVPDLPDTTVLIFVDADVQQGNPLLRSLSEHCTVHRETTPNAQGLLQWIKQRAEDKGPVSRLQPCRSCLNSLAAIFGLSTANSKNCPSTPRAAVSPTPMCEPWCPTPRKPTSSRPWTP